MTLKWKYPKDKTYFHDPENFNIDLAETWMEQDCTNLLFQSATTALRLLATSKLPSLIEHDGGYICSKSIYPNIKRGDRKAVTYDKLLATATNDPFYKYLKMESPCSSITL